MADSAPPPWRGLATGIRIRPGSGGRGVTNAPRGRSGLLRRVPSARRGNGLRTRRRGLALAIVPSASALVEMAGSRRSGCRRARSRADTRRRTSVYERNTKAWWAPDQGRNTMPAHSSSGKLYPATASDISSGRDVVGPGPPSPPRPRRARCRHRRTAPPPAMILDRGSPRGPARAFAWPGGGERHRPASNVREQAQRVDMERDRLDPALESRRRDLVVGVDAEARLSGCRQAMSKDRPRRHCRRHRPRGPPKDPSGRGSLRRGGASADGKPPVSAWRGHPDVDAEHGLTHFAGRPVVLRQVVNGPGRRRPRSRRRSGWRIRLPYRRPGERVGDGVRESCRSTCGGVQGCQRSPNSGP